MINLLTTALTTPAATAIYGFIAGIFAKAIGERVLSDSFTKRQIRQSIYKEIAYNYSVIMFRLGNIDLYPEELDTRPVEIKTAAYNSAISNIVLYSGFSDAHYIDGVYERLKQCADSDPKTDKNHVRLLKHARSTINDALLGKPKLLKRYLPTKYKTNITG